MESDDRASNEALFRFLHPSILPAYLTPTTWTWGERPEEPTAAIEFLTYRQPATGASRASIVSLRLFNRLRTGLALSVSCPSDEQLTAALEDVRGRVSVVPPRS